MLRLIITYSSLVLVIMKSIPEIVINHFQAWRMSRCLGFVPMIEQNVAGKILTGTLV